MGDGVLIGGSNFAGTFAQAPKTVGEAFSKVLQVQAANTDVFSDMEGTEDSGMPFAVKQDLTKGGGNLVNFTTLTEINSRGKLGEQQLIGNEQKPDFGSYNCRVEIVREGIAMTQKMKAFLATGKSIEGTFSKLLGRWFGRKRQADMMIMLRNFAIYRNTFLVNGKSFNLLQSTDTISTSVITDGKTQLITLGAKSCNLTRGMNLGKKKANGEEIRQYLLFGPNILLKSLKSNSSYLTAAEYAQSRGPNNTIFRGGYTNWDGNAIFEHNVSDPDGTGPLGAPILPRALLGTAIVAGQGVVTITGDGIATPSPTGNPFDWFLGYDYQFYEEQDPNPDPNTYYLVILNTTGVDQGKWGVYSYTGSANNGTNITITNRLGPTAGGAAVTTLANTTWNATNNTNEHPTGSLIFQVNALTTMVGWAFMLGAMAAVRCYGNLGDENSGQSVASAQESGDYKMKKGLGMMACYGQSPALDTKNIPRNYLLVPCAVNHPEAPASLQNNS